VPRQLDSLMKISNRGEYDQELSLRCSDASTVNPLSLIMIDLDDFKSINDSFGHPVGDKVLVQAAEAISQVVAGKGEAFRYGGEEVAVLLPNHSLIEAQSVAERIRLSIEKLIFTEVESGITASFGVSTFPDIAGDAEQLVKQADDALYESKNNGKNKVTCAIPESGSASFATRRKRSRRRVSTPVGEAKLSSAKTLLDRLTVLERDALRVLLINGPTPGYVFHKTVTKPEPFTLQDVEALYQSVIVQHSHDEESGMTTFTLNESWKEVFASLLFPRDEAGHPPYFSLLQ
jgi:diguanylate cyclase (GGDEF)-like protein